jgi:hypothetical protein
MSNDNSGAGDTGLGFMTDEEYFRQLKANEVNTQKYLEVEGGFYTGVQKFTLPGSKTSIYRSADWIATANHNLRDPETSWVAQYPSYFIEYIDWNTKYGTYASEADERIMRLRHGVPMGSIGGGGGGSGVNRANNVRSMVAEINKKADLLGLSLDSKMITDIAGMAVDEDYSTTEVQNAIVKLVDWNNLKPGSLKTTNDSIKSIGKQYLINVSDNTAREYSTEISKGSMDIESVKAVMQQQAKIAHPWMASILDAGDIPSRVLSNSQDKIASSLGLDSSAIDFTDNQYLKMIVATDDKGQQRLANDSELTKNIRSDSRWANTREAKQLTSGLAQNIAQIFGRSAF